MRLSADNGVWPGARWAAATLRRLVRTRSARQGAEDLDDDDLDGQLQIGRGDQSAADHILGVRPPGASVAPTWLVDESRAHSTAVHKQGLRTRDKTKGGGKGDGKEGGKGRGGGRGRPTQSS